MKIRFKLDQRADLDAPPKDRQFSTIAMLQISVKIDGFYGPEEITKTIAERLFQDHRRTQTEIAEWAVETIATMLRPLVPKGDLPKEP